MKRSAHPGKLVIVAIIASLSAAATLQSQTPDDLDSAARARIEQARASMVIVKAENQSPQPVSKAVGFLIRSDLVATDIHVLNEGSPVSITTATTQSTLKVLSRGNYFLPYVLLEKQPEIAPLLLGNSEGVAVNDNVYVVGDEGAIAAGKVTGTTTVKGAPAFLISIPINSGNRGTPIFNRNGEVIGIAAESPDSAGAGLAFPSSLLAKLKHLGEPGVGAGSGDGPLFEAGPPPRNSDTPATSAVDEKPVRLRSPAPQYTEAARANKINGTVVLRVLVGTDGDVKQVRVVSGLPDGLNEKAIEAARQAKFKPAMKDGKPVPYWVGLEMNFNIR
jgi:TonB family protein